MWAKRYTDTEKYLFKGEGNDYYMLVPRDMTQSLESCLVVLRKGEEIPAHAHPEEQVYFIIRGRGVLRVGDEERAVEPEMVAYIPGNEPHQIRPTSDELVYAYVQVWKGGVPADKLDWRRIYGVNTDKATRPGKA